MVVEHSSLWKPDSWFFLLLFCRFVRHTFLDWVCCASMPGLRSSAASPTFGLPTAFADTSGLFLVGFYTTIPPTRAPAALPLPAWRSLARGIAGAALTCLPPAAPTIPFAAAAKPFYIPQLLYACTPAAFCSVNVTVRVLENSATR